MKQDSERLMPFVAATSPCAFSRIVDYQRRFDAWFEKLMTEKEEPNHQQLHILYTVRGRLLIELALEKEGSELRRKHQPHLFATVREEPMRALIHGLPGTGKSRVVKWTQRLLTEGMQWNNGVHFLYVAFQNRVAYAMGGCAMHSAGDLPIGGSSSGGKLAHQDVNEVFTKNQHLRGLLIDECFMIPDDLLGLFSTVLQDAAKENRYLVRLDNTIRPFGGYNVLFFGDTLQIPPTPPTSALFIPPPKKLRQRIPRWKCFGPKRLTALTCSQNSQNNVGSMIPGIKLSCANAELEN